MLIKKKSVLFILQCLILIFSTHFTIAYSSSLSNNFQSNEFELIDGTVVGTLYNEGVGSAAFTSNETLLLSGYMNDDQVGGLSDIFLMESLPLDDLFLLPPMSPFPLHGGLMKEYHHEMLLNSNSEIYILGSTRTYGAGGSDIMLYKFDTNHTLLWNKTWGYSADDLCLGMEIDSQDNIYLFALSGVSADILSLIKYNPLGHQIWNISIPAHLINYYGEDIMAIDQEDNIIVIFTKSNHVSGGDDYISIELFKINQNGLIKWNKSYVPDREGILFCGNLILDSLNNIYLCSTLYDYSDFYPIFIKYSSTGIKIFDKELSINLDSEEFRPPTLYVDASENLYLQSSKHQLWKFDSSGINQWMINLENCVIFDVAFDSVSNVLITGEKNSNLFLYRVAISGKKTGELIWAAELDEYGYIIMINPNDFIFIVGRTNSFVGESELGYNILLLVVKYAPNDFSFWLIIIISIISGVSIISIVIVILILKKRKSKLITEGI